MNSPLELFLKNLLDSTEAKGALDAWLGHFASLAEPITRGRYLLSLPECRASLLGKSLRLWVPIGEVNGQVRRGGGSLKLFVKCSGRKLGHVELRLGTAPTFTPKPVFSDILRPSPSGAGLAESGALTAFRDALENLSSRPEFQSKILPEWEVEAWLLDFLAGKRKKPFSPAQPVRYPQKHPDSGLVHLGMYLQVSSPVSASEDGVPKLAKGANAHTDILVRMGLGGQRLGVLEVKAAKKGATTPKRDTNIAKALNQAFCYAFCYHQVFASGLLKADKKQLMLDVLGFGKPATRKTPALTAVAVIPEGYRDQVLAAANDDQFNLAAAQTVLDEKIRLEIWEYAPLGTGTFRLTNRVLLAFDTGKLVPVP